MPNDWFQFKQFKIEQDLCAMKVSTDACIQGAWAADFLKSHSFPGMKILDIGTGTGLLSLMLAQQNPSALIDAIELNENAFIQAQRNFTASPWINNLSVYHRSIQDFVRESAQEKYDFIICNPPFFHNHLQSQEQARNDARHSVSLSKTELAEAASLLLAEQGVFCVLYPQSEWQDWLNISSEKGWNPMLSLEVKPKFTSTPNRAVGLCSKTNNEHFRKETLVIYDDDKSYTEPFISLLQPYYLAL